MMPIVTILLTPDERAGLAVRAAIRVFRDGLKAADWLGTPNTELAGRIPLVVAKESESGCRAVCVILDDLAVKGWRADTGPRLHAS